ncbi:DUF1572 family protein [Aquimarina sp. TRL1]|uniref:DUF1572 family protein n=1 Tax=Aquimarina sp. (strain TRL1) TaxID=2736252 RepID=UPI00158D4AF6|nr:DUF1572 family protein [Aquimarina sp. TRL1]QKX07341.1 DUF1572 family protein [Aquimarina sp. TRL1]
MDGNDYIESIKKQFLYYKTLGEKTLHQLPDDAIFWQYNEASNSIAILIKHLWGNMMSRWTDFLTTDGEKEWRKRDEEFANDIHSKTELLKKWEEGWTCLFTALDTINKTNFDQLVYIRNIGHRIPEAIHRQLAHYSYHIGQIVYVGKMISNSQWQSLSIPKGGSKAYNKLRFSKEKHQAHYTDALLKDKNNTKQK